MKEWRGDYDSDEAYEKALEEVRKYFFEDDPDATEEEYEEHLQEFREACKWHIEDDLYEDFTFDENGFVINVSGIDAQGFEGEDCRQSYTDGCAPDYGFLESEIRRELAEDE